MRGFRRLTIFFSLALLLLLPLTATAQSKTEIEGKITDTEAQIKALEAEIAQYESQLSLTREEKRSLDNAIKQLDITRKKLASEITVTSTKVSRTSSNISELERDISVREGQVGTLQDGVAESLRELNEEGDRSLVEIVLRSESLSQGLANTDDINTIQVSVSDKLNLLHQEQLELRQYKAQLEGNKTELLRLRGELEDRKYLADINKREKANLLAETESKEKSYQELINQKIAQKQAFESELLSFEAQLKRIVDPNSIPEIGALLTWPVRNVRITQYFGDTAFSRNNPQIYSGKGHNGVDFGVTTGSEILAAAAGRVVGLGDTDQTCRGASWGKWIMVEHDNGLTTVSGHLSLHRSGLNIGDRVSRGETIAYSGSSGFSTGPHLHFSTYVSQAVEVGDLPSRSCPGKTYRIPLSPLSGYLNPLSYLPR